MNFVLFVLLNAVLLLRPEEFFPDSESVRLYLLTIVPCTVLSLPRLVQLLRWESLRRRPVAVCVLLFYAAVVLSLCVRGRFEEAFTDVGPEFGKVVLYYFLLLAVVDTRERFRAFVACLVMLIVAATGIALAQYYGVVDFPNITPVTQGQVDPVTNEYYTVPRMVGSGIFNDPNDLCLLLGLGVLSCLYLAHSGNPTGFLRWAWLLPVPVFAVGVTETMSRGGLLGVLAGVAAYYYARYGGGRGLPLAAAAVVGGLLMVGGRQANIGGGGTAHERLMLWAGGLTEVLRQPLYIPTGLGHGWYVAEEGFVAHNSFVQAYVETGAFGGGAFLAGFYLAARLTSRLGRGLVSADWVIQARPYGFAVVIGYAMGCYSLTRNFVIPTYLTLGLASVLLGQAAWTLPDKYQVNRNWFRWLAVLSIVGLVGLKFTTQGLGMAGI